MSPASHPVPSPLWAVAAAVLALAAVPAPTGLSFRTVEHQITSGPSFATLPKLGADASGAYVAYTLQDVHPTTGALGPGSIHLQRLNDDGAPSGASEVISLGGTDDRLPDVSGDRVVYTAYDDSNALLGRILLYDIPSGTTTQIFPTAGNTMLREPAVHGDHVAWVAGDFGATVVQLMDLNAPGVVHELNDPLGPASNVGIGERFVVWDKTDPSIGFRSVWAYDLETGQTIEVANSPALDQRQPSTWRSWITYEVRDLVAGSTAAHLIDMRPSQPSSPITVFEGVRVFAPSIDGDWVTVDSNRDGSFDVHLYRVSTGETFRLTSDPSTDEFLGDVLGDKGTYVVSETGTLDVYVSRFFFAPPLVVNTTDDQISGGCDAAHCSLREAILEANASQDEERIHFAIPGGGPHTIQVESPLPTIVEPVVIDGFTQSPSSPTPPIVLDGRVAGDAYGLSITAGNTTVRGLAITRFALSGIRIGGGGGNVIEGNRIGTDATGTTPAGNGLHGIHVVGSMGNRIGGVGPGAGNVIAGNVEQGVRIDGASASENVIQGNRIGIGTDGFAIPNRHGIILNRATSTLVGGPNPMARNIISGNTVHGIQITGEALTEHVIQGNYIGTDPSGTIAVSNLGNGVRIAGPPGNTVGGTGDGEGNLISGNGTSGVSISGSNNRVQGNLIGTDVTGRTSLGNGATGVLVSEGSGNRIGGTGSAARNVISGNARFGVRLLGASAADNEIIGNYIGTDESARAVLGNGLTGVFIGGGATSNRTEGNVIAHNGGLGPPEIGVRIDDGVGNSVLTNRIFGHRGLGIDLRADGVTPNDDQAQDADVGANDLQNFPVLQHTSVPEPTIEVTLTSRPSRDYRVEFFTNSRCHASGHGEGQVVVPGLLGVTTDASGVGRFGAQFPDVKPGAFITATATDPDDNTSEFSECLQTSLIPFTVFQCDVQIVFEETETGETAVRFEVTDCPGDDGDVAEACGGIVLVRVTAGDVFFVKCGSAIFDVVAGSVDLLLEDDIEAVVPAGASTVLDEAAPGEVTIENTSPAGADPIVIVSDDVPVGTLDAGASLHRAEIHFVEARLTRSKSRRSQKSKGKKSGKSNGSSEFDGFEMGATIVVPIGGAPIDVLSQGAFIRFGDFTQPIPAEAFEQKQRSRKSSKSKKSGTGVTVRPSGTVFVFKAEGNATGIRRFEIDESGTFLLEAERLDSSPLALPAEVNVSIVVGGHFAAEVLMLDEEGELPGGAPLTAPPRLGPDLTVLADDPVLRERSVRYTVTVGAGFSGRDVTLACKDLPSELACSFEPGVLRSHDRDATSILTVSRRRLNSASFGAGLVVPPSARDVLGVLWLALLAFAGVHTVHWARRMPRRRVGPPVPLTLLLMSVLLHTACDDSPLVVEDRAAPRTVAFTVTATADDIQRSASVELRIETAGD